MTWCEHHISDGTRHICALGHPIWQRFSYMLRATMPCHDFTDSSMPKTECKDAVFPQRVMLEHITKMKKLIRDERLKQKREK